MNELASNLETEREGENTQLRNDTILNENSGKYHFKFATQKRVLLMIYFFFVGDKFFCHFYSSFTTYTRQHTNLLSQKKEKKKRRSR